MCMCVAGSSKGGKSCHEVDLRGVMMREQREYDTGFLEELLFAGLLFILSVGSK